MGNQELDIRFTYYPPKPDQILKFQSLRSLAKELACEIEYSCPECREKSLALTKVEEAVMWANAAIARRS